MTGGLQSYPLCASNLPLIARAHCEKSVCTQLPAYDRSLNSFEGIICHLGVGGFFRSHQAVYTHNLLLKLMAEHAECNDEEEYAPSSDRWGIVGIGLMEWDQGMKNVSPKNVNHEFS
jgi:hypothetical protein